MTNETVEKPTTTEEGVWIEGPDGELVPDYEASFPEINEGEVVHGTVVRVDKDEVLVDIGYTSEGVIPVAELSIRRSVNPADEVSVGEQLDALRRGRSERAPLQRLHFEPPQLAPDEIAQLEHLAELGSLRATLAARAAARRAGIQAAKVATSAKAAAIGALPTSVAARIRGTFCTASRLVPAASRS